MKYINSRHANRILNVLMLLNLLFGVRLSFFADRSQAMSLKSLKT